MQVSRRIRQNVRRATSPGPAVAVWGLLSIVGGRARWLPDATPLIILITSAMAARALVWQLRAEVQLHRSPVYRWRAEHDFAALSASLAVLERSWQAALTTTALGVVMLQVHATHPVDVMSGSVVDDIGRVLAAAMYAGLFGAAVYLNTAARAELRALTGGE